MRNFIEVFEVMISSAARSASGISIELVIGRAGPGQNRAGPKLAWIFRATIKKKRTGRGESGHIGPGQI